MRGRWLAILLLVVACSTSHGVQVFDPQRMWDTPDWYEGMWEQVRACPPDRHVRPQAAFDSVKWYRAAGMFNAEGKMLAGLWRGPGRIYLDSAYVGDYVTVGHEMLHEILGARNSHDSRVFQECEARLIVTRPQPMVAPTSLTEGHR